MSLLIYIFTNILLFNRNHKFNSIIMNDEEIKNELKEIRKKLDNINKINENTRKILLIIIMILVIFFFMTFIYFSGHFPPL